MSNIKIIRNGLELPFKSFVFPGGEIGVKLEMGSIAQIAKTGVYAPAVSQTMIARLKSANDILELMMLRDALGENNMNAPTRLFMPYVPYGRQDRICDAGESFSLHMFTFIINSLNFSEVIVVDPHSNVTPALLNKVTVVSQLDVLRKWNEFKNRVLGSNVSFISPDAGSNKKVYDAASYFNKPDFLRADKLRDMTNGNIKETIVYADDLKGQDVCILDDLADGAKTFTELAKVLKKKNAGKILLYVTHGIFSKTVEYVLENGIDEIWTTDSFRQDIKNSDSIHVFPIESLLN